MKTISSDLKICTAEYSPNIIIHTTTLRTNCMLQSELSYSKKVLCMKKFLLVFSVFLLVSNIVFAKTDLNCPDKILEKKNLTVLKSGVPFTYPLKDGAILECYAKRLDGSIDDFNEYNDYFVMRNGHLYSNTMHKIYKPHKKVMLKKVDRASMLNDGKTLKLYDPLWEWSIRHHMRTIKINTQTGEYFMTGTQDNWMWYRNITSSGYCRVIQ